MPFIRSLAFKRLAYYFKLVTVILLLSKVIPTYLRYMEKGLIYIIIITLFNCQHSSYTKCTKLNIYFLYNVRSVSNTKYAFFTRLYTY